MGLGVAKNGIFLILRVKLKDRKRAEPNKKVIIIKITIIKTVLKALKALIILKNLKALVFVNFWAFNLTIVN